MAHGVGFRAGSQAARRVHRFALRRRRYGGLPAEYDDPPPPYDEEPPYDDDNAETRVINGRHRRNLS